MKNKLEQLAGNALDKVVPYTWTTLDYEEIHKILAYHAELIVRECAQVAGGVDGQIVLKHFGVEE